MPPDPAAPTSGGTTLVRLAGPADLGGWRDAARRLVLAGTPPEAVAWRVAGDGQAGLFDGGGGEAEGSVPPPGAAAAAGELRVPARFVTLAGDVVPHADPGRWALLYRLLWRIARGGERHLLDLAAEPDVARAEAMARAVRREEHRMRAFLRFREVWTRSGPRYVAWFEPEHFVLERCAGFLSRRFAGMRWVVVTPYLSAAWDGTSLAFGPGGVRADVPAEDAMDEAWRAYYANIFNPARANPRLMRQHMPKRYWQGMPETREIPGLLASAAARAEAMVAAEPTAPPARKGRVLLPAHPRHRDGEGASAGGAAGAGVDRPATLAAAATAVGSCRRCPLWEPATQAVFGEGPRDARVMLVGEQPGDREDLEGRPFVGPAGRLLDEALAEAGLERPRLYLTNAVKHFRFVPRGKRRLHQRADAGEAQACRFWLDLERELVRPRLVVALGATAAGSLTGREVAIGRERGTVTRLDDDTDLLVTAHPSSVLRVPDATARAAAYAALVADLRLAGPYLAAGPPVATRGRAAAVRRAADPAGLPLPA